MTTINNVNAPNTQQASSSTNSVTSMNSDAFMQMLMAQLQYQDPTKPMDSAQMTSQMSDLTMIQSMSDMKDAVKELGSQMYSSQSLYASTLVGQDVSVLANVINIEKGETVKGKVLLPTTADNLKIEVLNKNGEVVDTLPIGKQTKSGEVEFDLADLNKDLEAGKYTLKAIATVDGKETEAAIIQDTKVTGVVIPGEGKEVLIEVDNIGLVPLSYITRLNGSAQPESQSKSEINSFFNRELLNKYEGLKDSGIVKSDINTTTSNHALPPSPASLAMAEWQAQV
ncbi:hypothetical protein M3P05_09180 [Sansalvadorimonas sp. 2012CJ34-2]|uniref:Basal-body rod modification protein FlgD n=1 Tax=Parendozoicomonas callyspongiae TaxID=2942213 RepID=A0ABT0PFF0_9GAMM|nr:flagellar hook capping FlgD N-terminal domain-containing protein [Sansalvadorimonas sp. 2012CJ34-2]MCL6270104.1 hypothetical protein [Sansalvadorimonas sp. 2012CJ34-2]